MKHLGISVISHLSTSKGEAWFTGRKRVHVIKMNVSDSKAQTPMRSIGKGTGRSPEGLKK
ncbi:MAG: hypothetical protein ACHQIM_15695 [Sphingobacteriales bacterium]